jgi:hypothetical protein
MVSGMQDEYFERLGPERFADYISLYEKLIMLENLMQTDKLSESDIKYIENYIPQMMDHFSRTVDRQSGMGNKFVKFHLLLHLADDLKRNGVCQNTTTGPGEHRHISACKRPGKNTQRIAETFEPQVGKNYNTSLKVDKAMKELPEEAASRVYDQNIFTGKRFFLQKNVLYDYKKKKEKKTFDEADEWFDKMLMDNFFYFGNHFEQPIHKLKLLIYTLNVGILFW